MYLNAKTKTHSLPLREAEVSVADVPQTHKYMRGWIPQGMSGNTCFG